MGLTELGIKIKENKKAVGLETARFALSYKKNQSGGNYQILSRLLNRGDSLLEINESYISVSGLDKELYFNELISRLSGLNLEYKHRKIPVVVNRGLFSFLTGPAKTQADELLVYLPAEVWNQEQFQRLFPIYGARYYLLGGEVDSPSSRPEKANGETLEEFYQLSDTDKMDRYSLIVFDPGDLSMMGINSQHLTLEALQDLLEAG